MVFRTTSLLTAARSSAPHSGLNFLNAWGTLHHLTTAYHPQANGMVERSHRQLKDALKARTAGADWPSHLPWGLLGLRAAPKEDSSISSAELLYGAPLVLPGQLPGVPEPPPAVFHESSRAAPSHIPARGPPTPKELQEVPLQLQGASFVYSVQHALRRRVPLSKVLCSRPRRASRVSQRGQAEAPRWSIYLHSGRRSSPWSSSSSGGTSGAATWGGGGVV